MSNEIVEIRNEVDNVKSMVNKLAQSMGLTNEVLTELTSGLTEIVSNEVKGQIKEEMTTRTQEMKGEVLTTIGNTITETVNSAVAERGLNRKETSKLTKTRNKKMYQLLGDVNSDKYKLFAPFYFSQMGKEYRKQFNCDAYGDVNANRFDEAIEFLNNFTISQDYHEWCVSTLHKDYRNDEIESNKKLNAYKRYFGLIAA